MIDSEQSETTFLRIQMLAPSDHPRSMIAHQLLASAPFAPGHDGTAIVDGVD